MSYSYYIQCDDCRGRATPFTCLYPYSWTLLEGMVKMELAEDGQPLLYPFIEDFNDKMELEDLLNQGYQIMDSKDFGYRICHCPRCHQLYNRFYYHLEKDGNLLTPRYYCPNDMERLQTVKLVEDSTSHFLINDQGERIHWSCSNCGGKKIIVSKEKVHSL